MTGDGFLGSAPFRGFAGGFAGFAWLSVYSTELVPFYRVFIGFVDMCDLQRGGGQRNNASILVSFEI